MVEGFAKHLLLGISSPFGMLIFFGGLVVSFIVSSVLPHDSWPSRIYLGITASLALALLFVILYFASHGLYSSTSIHPSRSPVDMGTILFVGFVFTPFVLGWTLGWPLGVLGKFTNSTRSPKM